MTVAGRQVSHPHSCSWAHGEYWGEVYQSGRGICPHATATKTVGTVAAVSGRWRNGRREEWIDILLSPSGE